MNKRLIIILLIILVIAIFISLFLARQNTEVVVSPQKIEQENPQPDNYEQVPVTQMVPAERKVIVIGTPSMKPQETPSPFNQEGTIGEAGSHSLTGASEEGQAASPEQRRAVVSKSNKLPTPQELNEMKAKNIVIY